MDKIAKLKDAAKGLIAGGILGTGAGVAAVNQIQSNRHNARTVKGWNTRRNNKLTKEAEDRDTISEVKTAVRSLGTNLNNPTAAATNYAKRKLISEVRKLIPSKPKDITNEN